ncbi:MAG: hypothetical protein WA460_06335 [Nitrososphaeraceae archaeon]
MGQTDWPCDSVVEYLQNSRLQNEQYLTQAEVVEDFRILSARPRNEIRNQLLKTC